MYASDFSYIILFKVLFYLQFIFKNQVCLIPELEHVKLTFYSLLVLNLMNEFTVWVLALPFGIILHKTTFFRLRIPFGIIAMVVASHSGLTWALWAGMKTSSPHVILFHRRIHSEFQTMDLPKSFGSTDH